MVKIEKLDHFGRGITYVDNKITFVSYALPNEEIEYKIIKKAKKYNLAIMSKLITKSIDRIDYPCCYFKQCGGCALQHLKYEKTIEFKEQKLKEILKIYADIKDIDVKIIKNDNPYNYRNKLSLKIKDGNWGFYEEKTHNLVKIEQCLLADNPINKLIKDIKYFHLINANVIIRTNYNAELLIIIKTKEKINIDTNYLSKNHKIVGIIVNDKIYYGEDKFINIINHNLFQVSYNSFFQVNPYVTIKLFNLITDNIKENSVVVDLFCGVGTLSIVAAKKAQKVYGIETIPNAIKNALINKKINKCDNIDFCLGDANTQVLEIKDKIDIIIVDPPRSGLSNDGLKALLKIQPETIIYISCNPLTLARDIKFLKSKYNLEKIYMADMFSYTYHIETICVLKVLN